MSCVKCLHEAPQRQRTVCACVQFAEPLESLDDSMFSVEPAEDPAVAAMREPLVVRECTQPTETLQVFTQQFERRYIHVYTYPGT